MRRIILAILLVLTISAAAHAGKGATAASEPESLVMASGIALGTRYKNFGAAGENSAPVMMGQDNMNAIGFGMAAFASEMPGPDNRPPKIENVRFNGAVIQPGDYVNGNVVITALVTDESGIDTAYSTIEVDGDATAFEYLESPSRFDPETGYLIISLSGLGDGDHSFSIYARDRAQNSAPVASYSFRVEEGDLKLEGRALNHPNPFAPPAQTTNISYTLNQNADIRVFIFNMVGQLIKRWDLPAGTEGGRAGYNQIPWDGVSDFGYVVPNDVYFCKIVAGGKVISKCKIAVLK